MPDTVEVLTRELAAARRSRRRWQLVAVVSFLAFVMADVGCIWLEQRRAFVEGALRPAALPAPAPKANDVPQAPVEL